MPARQTGRFVKGHVPHHPKEARRGGEEETASGAGAGVGGVSTAAEGKKLDCYISSLNVVCS
jgi:hypothetical protein